MSPISLVALVVPAHAFVPVDSVETPSVGRIQYDHPQVQAHLLHGPAWQRFVATDGAGWSARFDEATGTPRWLWGRGIAVPTGSPDQVAAAVRTILERHRDLLGFDADSLVLDRSSYNAAYDTWYVTWDVLRDGLAPYHQGLSARVKHGELVMITTATAPTADVRGSFDLTADQAIQRAVALGPAPTATHSDAHADRTLVEILDPSGLHLQRAWQVHTRTMDPPGKWVSLVDARSGALLDVDNEVRFATGTVSAYHRLRTDDGSPLVLDPLPLVGVTGDTDAAVTDATGSYTMADSTEYTTAFTGDYLTITNRSGDNSVLTASDPDLVWQDDGSVTLAEPTTWVAIHHVRDWAAALDPNLKIVVGPLDAEVNIKQNCNSYYDGSVHYFHGGGGCNNSGEIVDVVFHEWGHGFHESSIESGFLDPSLGEAAADTVAFLQTNDSAIGPYFFTNGDPVRDVAPDKVYPDDYRTNPLFSHDNGLIFGGAMWDLLQLFEAEYGVAQGLDLTSHLHAGLLKGGPDILGSYYEILVADDDDGDLENGTPHQCDIIDAFGRHGLVGFTLAATHEPVVSSPADAPTPIDVQVVSTTGACADSEPASATVHYRVDGHEWLDVPATVTGKNLTGEIPAQALGAIVEYYIDGQDTLGVSFSTPLSGDVAPYSYFSGDAIEVHCDDFEASDGGYTHSLVDGPSGPGNDDWEWGSPTGLGGDPTKAFSGSKVWGNDLGDDGVYNPGVTNYLVSPEIPTGHFDQLFLQYRRWLGVEDASYDQALILANDKLVWSNYDGKGSDQTIDGQWMSHSVHLKGNGDRSSVQIGFGMRSDPGLQLGGWTLDDVCVYAPATPNNRLGIDDFVAEDRGGPIGLTWTNPKYGPVEEVVVVKKADAYPTAHDDGTVIADLKAVDVGAAADVEDPNVDGSSGFYAVYASDGHDWSSYTIEGLNADSADPNDGGTATNPTSTNGTGGTGDGDVKDGCGCASTGSTAGGWLALAALGLVVRRRR